jgi:adenylylsulfate kinase
MCRMLSRQGMDVVCATISMFHQVRAWNRTHIHNYCEIYLRVPMEVLVARDQKGLYGQALAGAIDNVIGVNAPFEEPEASDIIVDNDGTRSPEDIVTELLTQIPTTMENPT